MGADGYKGHVFLELSTRIVDNCSGYQEQKEESHGEELDCVRKNEEELREKCNAISG